ncbi:adenosylcobinamide-GDP ribazoletransferase [Roseivivax isoporae]|uniref:Adenosylcobinamide-GDP ribazoletransferase n=1 Tax=Roseivivax isoporae LMG 25204 TaxID=1449351 RepID=X7F628_9RHOB|nr:adenosylcobinamide-GDP ribazoletransferase [Roseivivax isoporae]ETX28270.1 cobalamin synthase [Roseivivax isoporae LMG 25204]
MRTPARRLSEAQVALMLMTRLPAGRIRGAVPHLAAARWAYPLAGLPVGLIVWAVLAGALQADVPPLAAAFAAIAAGVLATGGLHHDGLADFADGIGGGRDAAHCLEIMRDSRIGSYGVLALVLALGLGAAALAGTSPPLAAILCAAVASRLAMLAVLDLLPPARDDGLGRSASARGPGRAWIPGAVTVAILWAASGAAATVALAVMAAAAVPVALLARRRIGGQTGDVLGAVQVTAETAGWVALAALA